MRNGPGDQRALATERTERWTSGLYCTAASSTQPGITLVEPTSSASENCLRQGFAVGAAVGLRCHELRAEQVALHQHQAQRLGAAGVVHHRVVTPAVIWCESDTRSTPEKAFSE